MPKEDTYFKPGNKGGGSPTGKRISTWMVELGNIRMNQWPDYDLASPNAQIAMQRLRKALDIDKGLRDTALIMEHTENKQTTIVHVVSDETASAIDSKLVEFEKPIARDANA